MSGLSRSVRRRLLTIGLVAALAEVTLVQSQSLAQPPPSPVGLHPALVQIGSTLLASDLGKVTSLTAPDDGSGRLFVLDGAGLVRTYRVGVGMAPGTYLDIRDRVFTDGLELGLLGLAPSPDFASTHTIYVAYTRLPDHALVLSRFRLDSADQASVPADREEVVLTQDHSEFSNHNAGQLAFGPDGYLYWSLGDGGGPGDPGNDAQLLTNLLGKIVRIDVNRRCGDQTYCVPRDNPFVHTAGARPEIYVYGLRNPWRFSFDPADRSLWIGDVGQATFEEVDHLTPRELRRGVNLGWSCIEGGSVFFFTRCEPHAHYTAPIFYYPTSAGCAIIGGHVYRGAEFATLAGGTYIAADYCTGTAWGIQQDPNGYRMAVMGDLPVNTTTFGVDQAGTLYVGTGATTGGGELRKVTFTPRLTSPGD